MHQGLRRLNAGPGRFWPPHGVRPPAVLPAQGNREIGLPYRDVGSLSCAPGGQADAVAGVTGWEAFLVFLPRMTLMHANAGAWAWVLVLSWHRRLIHGCAVPWDCVPRAASAAGCLSEQARTASHHSASIWRLGPWAVHPFHRKSTSWHFRQGTKPYACEQEGLHGASWLAEWRPAQLARYATAYR